MSLPFPSPHPTSGPSSSRGPSPHLSSSTMSSSSSSTSTTTITQSPLHPHPHPHPQSQPHIQVYPQDQISTSDFYSDLYPHRNPITLNSVSGSGSSGARFRSNSALSARPSPSLSPINTSLGGGGGGVGMHNSSKSLGSQLAYSSTQSNSNGYDYGHGNITEQGHQGANGTSPGYDYNHSNRTRAGNGTGMRNGNAPESYGGPPTGSSVDSPSPLSPPGNGPIQGLEPDDRPKDDVAAAVRGLRGLGRRAGGSTSPEPSQGLSHNGHGTGTGSTSINNHGANPGGGPSSRGEGRERKPSPSPGPASGFGSGSGSASASASRSNPSNNPNPTTKLDPDENTLRRIEDALAGSADEGDTLDLSRQDIRKIGQPAVQMFATGVGKGKKGVWRLALSYNSLRDNSIDNSFAQLGRLRYLNLKGNYLTQFPVALTELACLEILDLSKNRITSFPDVPGRLAHLKVLSLTNNKLVTLPGYMVNFAVLKVFKVDQNPIEWPPREVLGPLCDSVPPSRSKTSDAGSLTSGRSRKDEDLRPWIDNMKSWMRQRATESDRLLAQANEEEARRFSDDEPLSATSLTTSASVNSFRSQLESSVITPSSQETIRRAIPATSNAAQAVSTPYTPVRPSVTEFNRSAPTPDETPVPAHIVSPDHTPFAFPGIRHTRDTSAASFTSPPSASAPSSAHSRTPSGNLPQAPVTPAAPNHTRGASYTATQRLSGNLTAKKSLPDLRQSHAQIIQDRRNDGQPVDESRPLGLGIAAPGVAKFQLPGRPGWAGEMMRSPTAGPIMSGPERNRIMGRKASADMLRRGSGDIGMGGESLEKRNSQEGPQIDESRNSYFRRLSTLPISTLSKAIPPALLKFIDAIRGILYALSQLHSALRQYLVFAVNEKIASVFSRVMEPASNYMNTLINALDRFDSMSRRNTPPVHAIRSVVDAAKESIAVFAKVVAVLRMQIPALKSNDVRYTRTLLTMIYSSMAEVVCSWQSMASLLADIKPLLVVDVSMMMRSLGGQKMVPTGSLSGRTPISPIIERRESQSPASVSRSTVGGSPLVPQIEESPAPPPGKAGSLRTVGKSRRQAGSFSSQDVEKGMLMGSPGGPRTAELAEQNGGTPNSYLRHRPSESANISLDLQAEESEDDDDEDDENERISFTPAQPAFTTSTSTVNTSPNEGQAMTPGTPPEIVSTHPQPIAMVPTTSQNGRRGHGTGHRPSSSSGSSHALSMSNGISMGPGAGAAAGTGSGQQPISLPNRKLSVDVRPPTPASASVFDEDLLDVIESATDIAFTCWLKLAEDVGASSPPFSSNPTHQKSSSQSSVSSNHLESARSELGMTQNQPFTPVDNPRRPPTISAKNYTDLLQLLSVAEQITAALRESLMGLRANPMTYATTTLPDDAQAFIKTVVKVSELVKRVSATHQFPTHVRQACSRLTQHTRECAILIQVSSLRPSNSTPAPIPMSANASTTNLGMGSRHMYPLHSARGSNAGLPMGGSQEDLSLSHGHGQGYVGVPHSAGWNMPTSGGWDSLVSQGQSYQKEGLRGLQLPSRQMALSRSRSANAVPQP